MTVEGAAERAPVRHTNSLLINVSTLLQESIGSMRQYDVDVTAGPETVVGDNGPVTGTLRLLRTDQSVLASAHLSTNVADQCSCCLEEIDVALELSFDEEFWPSADVVSGIPIEPPPERVGFSVIDGQIDLSEAVRQYVEMERPMSPRCSADCPGVGADLSAEPEIDSRWAALSALKIDTERE